MKNHGNDLKKMNVAQSESIISLLIMPSQSNVIEDNYHEFMVITWQFVLNIQ